MAKGKKCRVCGYAMYADQETNQPKGRWVVYVCRNIRKPCTNREKVFEQYADAR